MNIPQFSYSIEPLSSNHNRENFYCDQESLNEYLKKQARQDLRRFLTTVFVLQDLDKNRIVGYYTLAASSIRLQDLPENLTRKLPKYSFIPATLLGRLAIDQQYQGQGLGSFLLIDALRRSKNSEIASMAVIVEAKNARAKNFYQHHQFVPFLDQPLKLYLLMTTITKILA